MCVCGGGGGEEGSLYGIKFGTFIGRFPSNGAACMAVKGLIRIIECHSVIHSFISK